MGTSHTGAQMAAKIDKLGRDLRNTKRPLNVTALEGKRIFQAMAAAAGASRLARARYDLRGDDQAVIRYAGAKAHLVNNPTRAHRIVPRSRRGRGRRALTINGDVRASANHRGTSGKQFFQKARVICEIELPRVYGREQLTEPLRRTF